MSIVAPESSGDGGGLEQGGKLLLAIVSLAMVAFTLHNVYMPFLGPVEAGNIHLGFGLTLVFLTEALRSRNAAGRAIALLLLAVGLSTTGYIGLEYEALQRRIGIASTMDTIVGVALILVVFEATRRVFGVLIPLFAFCVVLYAYFGELVPGFLHHAGFSFTRLIGNLSTYLTGIYSGLLFTSTSIIAVFMIFGGLLGASGATNYFVRLALRVGQRLRSGPALAAVAASALFGSVNGSPVANASTTGTFTIPLMRKHGYSGSFAAATEAVASTGGTLMPPIMGVAAFMMASITGISYIVIAGHALIPAILFFSGVAITVHLRSGFLGLKPVEILPSQSPRPIEIAEAVTFFVPIGIIVALMLAFYPASYAALMGVVALVVMVVLRDLFIRGFYPGFPKPLDGGDDSSGGEGTLDSLTAPQSQPTWRQLLDGAIEGATGAARIAVVVATLGIIVHAFTMTGLAGRTVHQLSGLSGDSLFLALVVVAFISMLFGLGVPTAGSYVIVAILGAPILVGLDVPLIGAHLFILYFTMLSGLTPPVGATVIVTSQMAKTSYWKAALQSLGLALPGFIVPFLYVYEPAVLGIGAPATVVWTACFIVAGVFATAVTLEGYLWGRVSMLERIATGISAVLLYASGAISFWLGLAGIVCLAAISGLQFLRSRRGGELNQGTRA